MAKLGLRSAGGGVGRLVSELSIAFSGKCIESEQVHQR